MTSLGPSSSALELAAALRGGELSAVELLDACLAAVDELNPRLNAVIWRNDEDGRAAAAAADRRLAAGASSPAGETAPFLGVPLPIKDLTPVAGWPVTYGSRGAPAGASADSELVVDALARAGFVLCGRTNTPEFGVLTVAENDRYGISRNPWDPNRSPGGSSGGAAAAVAGGMFPIAHANDGGGSIRIPASYCGLVGLKPSRGRVPRLAQSWLGAVVEGVVARTVADSAAVLDAIAAPDPLAWYNAPAPARPFAHETDTPPGSLRVGLMAQAPLGMPTDEPCSAAARAAAATLEELGHTVEEVEVPTISEELIPPFIALTVGGLADYEGVDWTAVEPHIVHQRRVELGDGRLRLRTRRADTRAAQPPRGGALGPRLRRADHTHLGDPAAGRGRGAGGPACGPRPAGAGRRQERRVHGLRQRHRAARGEPAAALERGGPAGGCADRGGAVAGGQADRAGRAARAGAAVGRAPPAARAGRVGAARTT